MADDLFMIRCAKCGKKEYTIKSTPLVKGWEFVNRRLICSECAAKINSKKD